MNYFQPSFKRRERVSSRLRRNRRGVLFLLALGAVVISAIVRTRPRVNFVARTDGTSIGILGLTLSSNITSGAGAAGLGWVQQTLTPPYWRLTQLLQRLPKSLSPSRGAYDLPLVAVAPTNSLGIWIGERFLNVSQVNPVEQSIARIDLIATNGFRFQMEQPAVQNSGRWNNGRTLTWFYYATAFPRRQRVFDVELHDRNPTRPVVRFSVANPFWRPVADWTPTPMPSQKNIADTPVTLTRFVRRTAGGVVETNAFEPVFDIGATRDGTRFWRLGHWSLSDASGNWGPILDSGEPAWRVAAQFLREIRGIFPRDDIWSTNLTAFPIAGEFQLVNESVSIRGHRFRIIALAGPGKYDLRHDLIRTLSADPPSEFSLSRFRPLAGTGGVPELTVASPTPLLLLRSLGGVIGETEVEPFGIRLRDGSGSEILTTERFRGDVQGVRCYPLIVPANAAVRLLELILPTPVDLEFTVPPVR